MYCPQTNGQCPVKLVPSNELKMWKGMFTTRSVSQSTTIHTYVGVDVSSVVVVDVGVRDYVI